MKEINIKNILVILVATMCLASCLKKDVMNIDTEEITGTIMELQFIENGSGSTINSGMQYFSGGALTYPASHASDTATYNISIAGPKTLATDLNVTIGVDAAKVLDNFASDSISYELMPDSLYHIISSTATIPAGSRIAPMNIVFFPSKIDITKSYMLPIVIKDAAGQTISGNFNTIYFHVIGNPLAGGYKRNWIRYNTITATGTPVGNTVADVVFAPVNPTTISVVSGTGPKYLLSFVNTNGVLSKFTIKLDAKSVTDAGITILGGPTVVVADPVAHKFEFNYTYDNNAGGLRNITDKFY